MIIVLFIIAIIYVIMSLHAWFFIQLIVIKEMLKDRGIYKKLDLVILSIFPVGMFIGPVLIIYVIIYYVWKTDILVSNMKHNEKVLNDKYHKLVYKCVYTAIVVYSVVLFVFLSYTVFLIYS